MKNTRFTALVLTFVLLFGCFSVLPVFAEEEAAGQQVEILAQNVVYGEKIQIAYALNCDVNEDVTVEYTVNVNGEPVTYKAERYKENYTDEKEDTYPVYVTRGFHATDFTDVVSVVAYTGDTAPEGATSMTYSVAEYLYNMLYKHGYISYTENDGELYDKQQLYLSLIDYGTYAQKVVNGEKGDALLSNYCYLWTEEEGVTINGSNSALVAPGTEVTFAGASSFILTDTNGETAEATASYTAQAGMIAKVTADNGATPVVTDFEGGNLDSTYVTNIIGMGSNGEKAVADFTEGEMTGYVGTYVTLSVISELDAGISESVNKVLAVNKVRQPTSGSSSNGTASYTSKTRVALSNNTQVGECYTFETDMYISDVKYDVTMFNIVDTNANVILGLRFYNDSESTFYIQEQNTNGGTGCTGDGQLKDSEGTTMTFATGKWYTLRIEWYRTGETTSTMAKIYLYERGTTPVCIVDQVMYKYQGLTRTVSYMEIQHRSARAGKTYFDNISFARTDKAYVAETTAE